MLLKSNGFVKFVCVWGRAGLWHVQHVRPNRGPGIYTDPPQWGVYPPPPDAGWTPPDQYDMPLSLLGGLLNDSIRPIDFDLMHFFSLFQTDIAYVHIFFRSLPSRNFYFCYCFFFNGRASANAILCTRAGGICMGGATIGAASGGYSYHPILKSGGVTGGNNVKGGEGPAWKDFNYNLVFK